MRFALSSAFLAGTIVTVMVFLADFTAWTNDRELAYEIASHDLRYLLADCGEDLVCDRPPATACRHSNEVIEVHADLGAAEAVPARYRVRGRVPLLRRRRLRSRYQRSETVPKLKEFTCGRALPIAGRIKPCCPCGAPALAAARAAPEPATGRLARSEGGPP